MSRNHRLDHLERSFQFADAEFGLDLEQSEHVTACGVGEDVEVWVHGIYIPPYIYPRKYVLSRCTQRRPTAPSATNTRGPQKAP